MTAKRGTLWKTSWRRQKTAVPQAPVQMWFFNTFQVDFTGRVWYQQPLDTPTIGDTDGGSFWVGMIAAPGGTEFGARIDRADTPPNSSDLEVITGYDISNPTVMITGGYSNGMSVLGQVEAVPALGVVPPVLRAVVTMLVVEDLGNGSRRQTLWVDGAIRLTAVIPSPYNATAGRKGTAKAGVGYLNSWAGGNAVPTEQEIRDWFQQSRYATPFPSAQPIPGKTLDRFDAGAVPGTVPSPLTNLAGGQNMLSASEGVSPAFANTLFAASFGY